MSQNNKKQPEKKGETNSVLNPNVNTELNLTETTAPKTEVETENKSIVEAALETAGPVTEDKIEEVKVETETVTEDGAAPQPTAEVDAAGNPIPAWYKKHQAEVAKENPTELREILAVAITKNFADRSKTCLPGLTEKDIRTFAGPNGKSVQMEFIFSNDEKTSGYITITEFGKTLRVPEEGEFTFGIDFSND